MKLLYRDEVEAMSTNKIKWMLWAYQQDNMHYVDIEDRITNNEHRNYIKFQRRKTEHNISLCIRELKRRGAK